MNRFQQVLTNSAMRLEPLGRKAGVDATELKQEAEKREQRLIADLEAISARNSTLAWIVVAGLVILFLASLWLALFQRDLPSAQVAMGVLGVSAAGGIRWLHSLWTERSSTELLLRLAVDMKGEALNEVVKVLAKRALSPGSGVKTPK